MARTSDLKTMLESSLNEIFKATVCDILVSVDRALCEYQGTIQRMETENEDLKRLLLAQTNCETHAEGIKQHVLDLPVLHVSVLFCCGSIPFVIVAILHEKRNTESIDISSSKCKVWVGRKSNLVHKYMVHERCHHYCTMYAPCVSAPGSSSFHYLSYYDLSLKWYINDA